MRYFHSTCLILSFVVPVTAYAQWLSYPTPGMPRTAAGKPNLAAPAPRTADGKPDLSGLWQSASAPAEALSRLLPGANGAGEDTPSQYFMDILDDFRSESPMLPAVAAAYKQRLANFAAVSPISQCLPPGMPLAQIAPHPYKILQMPGVIAMLYERDTNFRQIFLDNRPLPADPQPSWMGYSVGKWEGDTLVVETNGITDRSWLDVRGHTHSELLRITERFRRVDFGHLEVQMTLTDPKTFTKPVTIKLAQRLRPDTELLEYFCAENEKDLQHFR